MLATLSLLLWLIGLLLVLKYRVHIHVNIETNQRKSSLRGLAVLPKPDGADAERRLHAIDGARVARGPADPQGSRKASGEDQGCNRQEIAEIAAALIALGCKKAKAQKIAARVCSQPGSFDELLRAAIREAA